MKISFLILLFSISLTAHANERLKGISDSMGESTLFKSMFDGPETQDRQREEITEEIKLQAESDVSQLKEGERHPGIKDDSHSFAPKKDKEYEDTVTDIDIISDINAEFEDLFKKLESAHRKPKQIFSDKKGTNQATINTDPIQKVNQLNSLSDKACVKERVYTLNVENAAQYERLEDFPFTYECIR